MSEKCGVGKQESGVRPSYAKASEGGSQESEASHPSRDREGAVTQPATEAGPMKRDIGETGSFGVRLLTRAARIWGHSDS